MTGIHHDDVASTLFDIGWMKRWEGDNCIELDEKMLTYTDDSKLDIVLSNKPHITVVPSLA